MWTKSVLTAFLMVFAGSARADFSLICDEQAQIEDVLHTDQAHGFEEATQKFRAYVALMDDRSEATCALGRVPHPARVGQVVAHFEAIEFIPGELHDVVVVEVRSGGRVLFGTINRYVGKKKSELGT